MTTPAFAINYGEPVPPSEFPTVGEIVLTDVDGEPLGRGTGTLIAPDILLTAAHVVCPATSPHQITFRSDADRKKVARGVAYRIHREFYDIYTAPADAVGRKYVDGFQVISNDIALVRLDRSFPTAWPYYKLSTQLPRAGTRVTAIGYGRDETRRTENAGIRRKGLLKYQKRSENVLLFVAGDERGQRTDSGDSGGPLLMKNGDTWEIAALVNGHNLREKIEGFAFDEYGYYVSARFHREWIATAKKSLEAVPIGEREAIYMKRGQTNELHPALTTSQYEAFIKAGTPVRRIGERLIRRGVADPIPRDLYQSMRQGGVPETVFLRYEK